MKTCYFFVAVLFLSVATRAQTLSPIVIASSGGFSSNANNSISYTVGEMAMVQTFSSAGNILTQGFQQPNDIPEGLLNVPENGKGDLVLYPNPAVDKIWYAFQFSTSGSVSFSLTNILGQKLAEVYHMDYEGGKISQTAQVSALASGTYFLTATFVDRTSGSISQITKKLEVIR
jgi:hypothetical protein